MYMLEQANLEFRLRKIDETKKLSSRRIKQWFDEWKYSKTPKYLNHAEHLLIVALKINGWISTFAFNSLIGVPFGITSSGIGISICAMTARI